MVGILLFGAPRVEVGDWSGGLELGAGIGSWSWAGVADGDPAFVSTSRSIDVVFGGNFASMIAAVITGVSASVDLVVIADGSFAFVSAFVICGVSAAAIFLAEESGAGTGGSAADVSADISTGVSVFVSSGDNPTDVSTGVSTGVSVDVTAELTPDSIFFAIPNGFGSSSPTPLQVRLKNNSGSKKHFNIWVASDFVCGQIYLLLVIG